MDRDGEAFVHMVVECMKLAYVVSYVFYYVFFSSRRRHTRYWRDWSSDVCSSDLSSSPSSTPSSTSPIRAKPRSPPSRVQGRRGTGATWRRGPHRGTLLRRGPSACDRERGVLGKRGGVGRWRVIKKKKLHTTRHHD